MSAKRSFSKNSQLSRRRKLRGLNLELLEAREVFAAGDLDTGFGAGTGIVTQNGLGSPDGMEIKTAANMLYVGNKAGLITRFSLTGALDTNYGLAGSAAGNIAPKAWNVQSDGRAILVSDVSNTNQDVKVQRLVPLGNTTPDPTFNNNNGFTTLDFQPAETNGATSVDDFTVDVEVDSNNKIWVLTNNDTASPTAFTFHHSAGLARLTSSGVLDTTFSGDGLMTIEVPDPNPSSAIEFDVSDLVLLPSGGAIVLGVEDQFINPTQTGVAYKVNANGTLDTTFGTGGKLILGSISPSSPFEGAVTASGEIYIGAYKQVGINQQLSLMKFNSNGTPATFGTGGSVDNIYSTSNTTPADFGLAVQADGKPIVSYDNAAWKVSRYNTDGTPETTWGGTGTVNSNLGAGNTMPNPQSIVVLSSGQIVVAGRAGDGQNPGYRMVLTQYVPASASVTSQVAALPADSYRNDVTVTWSGVGIAGATITGYDVYYKVGSNPDVLWQNNVPPTTTSAVFIKNTFDASSARRQLVSFWSRAHDNSGGIEAAPATPDTTTNYAGAPWQNPVSQFDVDGLGDGTQISDLLKMIFEYNHRQVSAANGNVILPPADYTNGPYTDVTGDNLIDINDILKAIFAYNTQHASGESVPSGESPVAAVLAAPAAAPVADAASSAAVTAAAVNDSAAPPASTNDAALLALLMCSDQDDDS